MSDGLITKYRPTKFSQVVGQDAVVKALERAIAKGLAKTLLFTGPSGTGKTTLARIAAAELGCLPGSLIEIDAATHTGIENMRDVMDGLRYLPLGEGRIKVVLIDECHALSAQAWKSILKATEEPPEHVYWMLCTTEPTKVPETIRTRCMRLDLKPVGKQDLADLLYGIVDAEKLAATDDVVGLCVREAHGSPRQALSNLTLCADVTNKEEAGELLHSAATAPQAFELARLLNSRGRWSDVQRMLAELSEAAVDPESVRHVVRAYMTKIALTATAEAQVGRALEILDAFSQPFNHFDGASPLVLACGKLLLGR